MCVNKFKRKFGFIVVLVTSFIITVHLFKDHGTRQTGSAFTKLVDTKRKSKYIQPDSSSKTGSETKHAGLDVNKAVTKKRKQWKSLPPGTQMGEQQVAAIIKALPQKGNLLVWGLGNDSPFWHDSTQGKVIFIEPKGYWFDKIKSSFPFLEAYQVNYTTNGEKSLNKYINNRTIWSELDLRTELPPVVTETLWDVIIVDAPPRNTGRYQSIYTSSLIAKNGTHIFVDDYERKVEREFSSKILGIPFGVVPRKGKGIIGPNQQAHFIYIKDNR